MKLDQKQKDFILRAITLFWEENNNEHEDNLADSLISDSIKTILIDENTSTDPDPIKQEQLIPEINEEFVFQGERYKCIEDNCNVCAFAKVLCMEEHYPTCTSGFRPDKTSVAFIRIE